MGAVPLLKALCNLPNLWYMRFFFKAFLNVFNNQFLCTLEIVNIWMKTLISLYFCYTSFVNCRENLVVEVSMSLRLLLIAHVLLDAFIAVLLIFSCPSCDLVSDNITWSNSRSEIGCKLFQISCQSNINIYSCKN